MLTLKTEHRRIRHERALTRLRPRLRAHPRSVVIAREQPLLEGKSGFAETMDSIRLKLLRDQVDDVVGMMKGHPEAIEMASMLLKDEGVGVAVIAADALKTAAAAGVDISKAEVGLSAALEDRYAKRHAAGALALSYLKKGDVKAVQRLLSNPDPIIHDAVSEACTDMSKPPSGR